MIARIRAGKFDGAIIFTSYHQSSLPPPTSAIWRNPAARCGLDRRAGVAPDHPPQASRAHDARGRTGARSGWVDRHDDRSDRSGSLDVPEHAYAEVSNLLAQRTLRSATLDGRASSRLQHAGPHLPLGDVCRGGRPADSSSSDVTVVLTGRRRNSRWCGASRTVCASRRCRSPATSHFPRSAR